jgi:hypothetical protein
VPLGRQWASFGHAGLGLLLLGCCNLSCNDQFSSFQPGKSREQEPPPCRSRRSTDCTSAKAAPAPPGAARARPAPDRSS